MATVFVGQLMKRAAKAPRILACLAVFSFGAAQATAIWARAEEAKAALELHRARFHIPGISAAICVDGKITFAYGSGYANVNQRIQADEETIYRLASISKPVTATIALSLKEDKLLSLDKPLVSYIKSAPGFHKGTLRQLMSHKAGVRHYEPGDNIFGTMLFQSELQAAKLFWNDDLIASPGDRHSYSTHGYTLVGAVLESVAQEPFAKLVIEKMEKWGFPSIRAEAGRDRPNRSEVYDGDNRAIRDNLSWKYAGGGMEASVLDLARFGSSLAQGKLVSESSLREMWTPQPVRFGRSDYGLGFRIGESFGYRSVWHTGSQVGANSYMEIFPELRACIVVLSNTDGHKPFDIGRYISAIYLNDRLAEEPYRPVPVKSKRS